MGGIDFQAINNFAQAQGERLLREWFPDGKIEGKEYVALNPTRSDSRLGSFKINMENGLWKDFATGESGGDLVSLFAYRHGLSQGEAAQRLSEQFGVNSRNNGGRSKNNDANNWGKKKSEELEEKVLAAINFEAYYRDRVNGCERLNEEELIGVCPFHGDIEKSLHINITNGKFRCNGCSSDGDIFKFHARTDKHAKELSGGYHGRVISLADTLGIPVDPKYREWALASKKNRKTAQKNTDKKVSEPLEPLPLSLVEDFHQELMGSEKRLEKLLEKRGITHEIAEKFKIGYNEKNKRLTIPMFDADGNVVNIRQYSSKADAKMISYGHGRGGAQLFGFPSDYPIDEDLLYCEGEFDRMIADQAGFNVITNTNGAKNFQKEWVPLFEGRHLVLVYDADKAGRDGAQRTARMLAQVVKSIKIIDLQEAGLVEGTPESKDISDLAKSRPDWVQELRRVIRETKALDLANLTEPIPGGSGKGEEKETVSKILLQLAADVELFHSPDGNAYATVKIGGHNENWPIKAKGFRNWLARQYYMLTEKAPHSQGLQDALNILDARAIFDGPELPVFVRLGQSHEAIYLDLGNPGWEAIEIKPDGWRVVKNLPVKFLRPPGMKPLPTPVKSKDGWILFKNVLNLDGDDFKLAVGWEVGSLSPDGPFPVLVIQGEQGSGKSERVRKIKAIIDPTKGGVRTIPREETDLIIAARNNLIVAFDNLSGCPPWLSDSFCRLATGGAISKRQLYTDSDEVILDAKRPLILNGITSVATRPDLVDRSIILNLRPIPETSRRPEKDLNREFKAAHPKILGVLLDAVSMALKNLESTKLDSLPRMADFAQWISAAEPALPWAAGEFMKAYTENQAKAVETTLENDPVALAVCELMSNCSIWEGRPSDLLEELIKKTPEQTTKLKAWPKAANALSNRLARAATFLRAVGIEVENTRNKKQRLFRIIRKKTVTTVTTVTHQQNQLLGGDGPGDDPSNESGKIVTLFDRGDDGDDRMTMDAEGSSSPNMQKSLQDDDGDDGDDDFPTHSKSMEDGYAEF